MNLTFQSHSKVKSNGAFELPIYDFLLVSNSKDMSISHHLAVLQPLEKNFPLSLIIWQFFSKLTDFFPGSEGRLPPKKEVDRFNIFGDILLADTRTDR